MPFMPMKPIKPAEGSRALVPQSALLPASQEDGGNIYLRMLELDRMQKRFERERAAFEEIERHYGDLMDSGTLLYSFVDPQGTFLFSNYGMRLFLGLEPESLGAGGLLSCCPPGQEGMMRELIEDALAGTTAALAPLVRGDGTPVWLDAEFSPATFRGERAVRLVGMDATEWMGLRSELQEARSSNAWERVLDSCPGLLCCVLDAGGKLVYASHGYRAAAARLFRHRCIVGEPYPPAATELDRALRDLVSAACLGGTNGIEIPERREDGDCLWEVAAAPLQGNGRAPDGAVIRIFPARPKHAGAASQARERSGDAAGQSAGFSGRMDLLNAFASRAVIVNDRGVCLAANSLFILSPGGGAEVAGRPLLDLIPKEPAVNEAFHRQFRSLLLVREGALECRIPGDDGELTWLEVRGRPVEWNGFRAVLLTCEDATRLRRTREQLERCTSVEPASGILSRQGMERLLVREVERALGDRSALSLIVMDIDGLHRMNETRGYAAADRALKILMDALKNTLSPRDIPGRWGGDEFVVLSPGPAPAACALANLLRDMAHNGAFDRENALTLSIGVAELSRDMDIPAFVGAAWDAMASARKAGGNRTVVAGGLLRADGGRTAERDGQGGPDRIGQDRQNGQKGQV